jgi:hypothetical protein
MSSGCGRIWRDTSDRGRAYSVLRAGTCPLALPLWSAKRSLQPHQSSQALRRERLSHARGVETSE